MDGLDLLRHLQDSRNHDLPVILITGYGDIRLAVTAMKAGAIDFLEKPIDTTLLLEAIDAALQSRAFTTSRKEEIEEARALLRLLTARETDVLRDLVAGNANKEIAIKLKISPRTVEHHRAKIMEKTGARGLPQLVRLWLAANRDGPNRAAGTDKATKVTRGYPVDR
jgi:FixJ family two-component response regulator